MSIVENVVEALQELCGNCAEEVGAEVEVIQRQRKFSALTLAQTFLFGFLQNPHASDEELAQMAGTLNVNVTEQAIGQRFTERLVDFMKGLFLKATGYLVQADGKAAAVLGRFSDVLLLDSTTISLPSELAATFPGCGGSHGGGKAAVKLQVQWSLQTGALDCIRLEEGKSPDRKTSLQQSLPKKGSLRIADLGYFDTRVFELYEQEKAYWLSPMLFGTNVYDVQGERLDLLKWLQRKGPLVDAAVRIGAERQVSCRLVAWRLPPEYAQRRRQKQREKARKKGRTVSAARLAYCDWAMLVTNAPASLLSIDEVRVLYRARWQIELLFKRWKSQGCIDDMSGTDVHRQMTRFWARLVVAIMTHWLLLPYWSQHRYSLKKLTDTIARFALLIAITWHSADQLRQTLNTMAQTLKSTARRNKRKIASTFQQLENPGLLEYANP